MSSILLQSTFYEFIPFYGSLRVKFLLISNRISNALAPRFGTNPSFPLSLLLLRLLNTRFYNSHSTFQFTVNLNVFFSSSAECVEGCRDIVSALRQLQVLRTSACSGLVAQSLQYLLIDNQYLEISPSNSFNPQSSPSFFAASCLTNLVELDLSFSVISDSGRELENIICPNAKNIRRLTLRQCHGVGPASLAAVAKNLRFLEYLNLDECDDQISSRAIKVLCDPLSSHLCNSLRTLILRNNYIVSESSVVEFLCQGLLNLTSLDLSHCHGNYKNTANMTSTIVDVEKCVFARNLSEINLQGIQLDAVVFFSNLLKSRVPVAAKPLRRLDLSYHQGFFSEPPPVGFTQPRPPKNKQGVDLMLNLFQQFFSSPFVYDFLEELILNGTDIIDEVVTNCGLFFINPRDDNCINFKSLRIVDLSGCYALTIDKSLQHVCEYIKNYRNRCEKLQLVYFISCFGDKPKFDDASAQSTSAAKFSARYPHFVSSKLLLRCKV